MTKLEPINFDDKSIHKVTPDWSYEIEIDGKKQTKWRARVYLPFKVGKKTSLKSLVLCVHNNKKISKLFLVRYWFEGKAKYLTIGKFIPGIFGTKQCEDRLFNIVKDNTNRRYN